MDKYLFIAEKPSVAKEFAKVLGVQGSQGKGYLESGKYVVTWCVGHLVTMSYPDVYDPALKKWSLNTLPFLPENFLYELIPDVKKQFNIVKDLLNREDITRIYVCTDSGREGEYIYRLVDQMAKVPESKDKRRVWIDSQTEEEIQRGIREAKPLSEYDNLSSSAYLRAKEDYLMGINFSRVLSLKYGQTVMNYLKNGKWISISVGRVMTCVLGMVVRREREIRSFVKTPFYRVIGHFTYDGQELDGEWRAIEGSEYFKSPLLYKENGFKKREDAEKLCLSLGTAAPGSDNKDIFPYTGETAVIEKAERKKEKKNPPLLFNLAELQNTCSKLFKTSPDETLKIVQELYEKKLVTYPRTDARVLSTAVAKEIHKNIKGLVNYNITSPYAQHILQSESYKGITRTRYVNDKQITDHYAIIPTGQGLGALRSLDTRSSRVYEVIVRRFLCIFYPPAEYMKTSLVIRHGKELFFANFKVLVKQGYLELATASFSKNKDNTDNKNNDNGENQEQETFDENLINMVKQLKKGMELGFGSTEIKEGETSPPKRYNSGSIILAMENAGQLIEDEELRAQIKGSGIGTSATRAEILSKLVKIQYLKLNKKTQIITPELIGEMVYDVVNASIRSLLNPELTASWELGLALVADGSITEEEYMKKLDDFIIRRVEGVKNINNSYALRQYFDAAAAYYK
ncbi:MAG: type IA DNA topoisomerase [Lachnospiraceae bacterium]|nr:type IA DNA topoisomerase [Lachnospiraceae bacterium]